MHKYISRNTNRHQETQINNGSCPKTDKIVMHKRRLFLFGQLDWPALNETLDMQL